VRSFSRWGIRARLIVALVGVAVIAAATATSYSNLRLDSRVEGAAQARLERSATHFAEVTATVYAEYGRWTPAALTTLTHLAEMDGLSVSIAGSNGRALLAPTAGRVIEPGARASADVVVEGRRVGHVTVAHESGRLLTPEEEWLRRELNRVHVLSGLVAAAIALVIALYLAVALSRPLREIRSVAESIEAGKLDARVQAQGYEEARAVGRALNRLAESLEQEEAARKASVADLAHELRTPAMGLLARLEAAQDGVLTDEAANLSAMHDEALRLVRLLDDLSTLADAERPGLLLDKRPVDLMDVASRATEILSASFSARDLTFATEVESVVIEGDASRLEQITINLLSNALRYTEPGGKVVMRVGCRHGEAVLEVEDTGLGITPEELPHVFNRFWRGEKSRSRATGGSGIGLAIVRELVRAHDGRIEVESTPDEGSVFRVILPALQEPALH
jgi:signal transduction histidine kinase